jgi:hypothetical protein
MAIGRIPEPGTGIPESIIAAKGDILTGTANDTPAVLSVGTNGHTLVADSAEATGLKWAAPASGGGGLTLVKTQTIGSAVSSVTVTDAFSATYDNYLIIVSDGTGSANGEARLTLGATTTNYYMSGAYNPMYNTNNAQINTNNGSYWESTYFTSQGHSGHINLQRPFLSKTTTFQSQLIATKSDSFRADYAGFLDDTTSYTAFTLTASTGTMTGGQIRVYGYQNS